MRQGGLFRPLLCFVSIGLHPCHPSLLLGLLLPKRPPTGPDPLPKTKRKSVAFKDRIDIRYFPLPSQEDAHQVQPPQPLSPNDMGCDCLAAIPPRDEPLFSEEPISRMFHEGLSSLQQEAAGGGTSLSLSDVILQLQCDSPGAEGQPGNPVLETLAALSQRAGIGASPGGPFHLGNPLGLLLPSEPICPNHHGADGAHGADLSDVSHVLMMLWPETVPPAGASEPPLPPQIPGTTPVAGDTDSCEKDTLSLLHHVTQLLSHVTPNQEPPPSLLLHPFSVMPPETASALSSVLGGVEFPAVQQSDEEVCAQLQLLLTSLGGQTQPPST